MVDPTGTTSTDHQLLSMATKLLQVLFESWMGHGFVTGTSVLPMEKEEKEREREREEEEKERERRGRERERERKRKEKER